MRTMKQDLEVYTMLANTGYATEEQLQELATKNRVKTLTRKKFIYPKRIIRDNGDIIKAFKLTSSGKKILRREKYISSIYSPRSILHDIHLTEKYLSLEPSQRNSWITKKENTKFILSNKVGDKMSAPDASFIVE